MSVSQSPFIYLASQSPRRQALLAQIGVRFELLLPEAHEDAEALEAVRPNESPDDYVIRVARAKANAAVARLARMRAEMPASLPHPAGTAGMANIAGLSGTANATDKHRTSTSTIPLAPILAADTTVALDGDILGKPHDCMDALRILTRLAGREHRVLSAIALVDTNGTLSSALSISTVRFAAASPASLNRYAASGEPLGKAGAYGIQGCAAEFIEHIEGSYSGIMGLPLFETASLLRTAHVAF